VRTAIRVVIACAAVASTIAGIAVASGDGPSRDAPRFERLGQDATFTTAFRSPVAVEGLTGDARGDLYSAQRAPAGEPCPVQRITPRTGAASVVGFVAAPCGPAGLTFDRQGRLYITGAGGGDQIARLTPDAANPPTATTFATGVPGANGVAFDRRGALWTGDGGTALGRVWRIAPEGGAATEVLRVPPMLNGAGVGREARSVPPGSPQAIVANGIAFTRDGAMLIADTARGALWRVRFDRDGNVRTRTGCDVTFTPNTLCLDAVFVAHPALEGADGIALDRAGNVWTAANERNALVVVTPRRDVQEFFRSPADATTGLRNAGPLEFPTSPFLSGKRLCVAQTDGARRDNAPNDPGEVGPGTGFAAKIACLDQPLPQEGLPLPVR
jgi:sugar lactone lactonase YvrE